MDVWFTAFSFEGFYPMANNAGARKAIRKIEARTEGNKARRTRVRTYLRKFQEALTGGDVEAAKAAFITDKTKTLTTAGVIAPVGWHRRRLRGVLHVSPAACP